MNFCWSPKKEATGMEIIEAKTLAELKEDDKVLVTLVWESAGKNDIPNALPRNIHKKITAANK